MSDLLLERWGSDIVTGDREAGIPKIIGFHNTVKGIELLRNHVIKNSKIAVHCDVDVDGIGSGYVGKKFLGSQGAINTLFLINKDKIHGIQPAHVKYFNEINNIDLLIILDSSTNEIELIKMLKCDVIVVDHHEIMHNELCGKTEYGYEYVIINNMIGNSNGSEVNDWLRNNNPDTIETITDYVADARFSGAAVLYEIFRLYEEAYKVGPALKNLGLFQWVGVTLFSDAILLASDRNQYYMQQTVHSTYIESSLKIMLTELNKYKVTLDKSFINFTFCPAINKAIRAGFGGEALDIVLNRPQDILKLNIYKETQAKVLELCTNSTAVYKEDYILKDITSTGVSKNYCGVIAARLCGENTKNAVSFIMNDGTAMGSFRGRRSDVNYRGFFESYAKDVFAQGHDGAFGFKVDVPRLTDIMSQLKSIEPEETRLYLTAGNVPQELRGQYHISDMDNFKRLGYLWRLAIANSKLSGSEQLSIIGSSIDVVLVEQRGKLFVYEIMGLRCKAFEPINTKLVNVYIEYSKDIEMYIKNFSI